MEHPGANALVIRKTERTLRDSCYADLKWAINRLEVSNSYQGYITIRGLADDSQVRIVDASGALITSIDAHGGTATWNGKNASGGRISSGVYTAICNTKDGKQHGTTKILIIN